MLWLGLRVLLMLQPHLHQAPCGVLDALHHCQADHIVDEGGLVPWHLQPPQRSEHQAAIRAGPRIATATCTNECPTAAAIPSFLQSILWCCQSEVQLRRSTTAQGRLLLYDVLCLPL